MMEIRNKEFLHFDEEGRRVERLELDLDTTADLPAAENGKVIVDGRVAAQGSIAWDISTGDFYGLKSGGTWYKQDGTGAYSSAAVAALSASLDLSDINRSVIQPISDISEMSEGGPEEVPEIEEREVEEDEPEPIRDFESR
ncbi:MAG: hypothetical protein IKO47_08870 [Ruminococcus sp.]|nr:hypothetical protein [Ruminococcus sp.]